MSKTDDIIKREISRIGNYKNLKMRYFVGSSNYDQELWCDGGLTFGYNGYIYGSNDFAWYRDEPWEHEFTGKTVNQKPIIVVEGTHCLNTKSYGTAQLQRFHHAYGAFLNNIISVYYLKEGKHPIRHDLLLAAYNASKYHRGLGNKGAYIVTDQIDELDKLVKLVGDFGEDSTEVQTYIEELLDNMKLRFYEHFERNFLDKGKNFEDYLFKRAVIKTGKGHWVKFLGPRKDSIVDPSIRYGHIVLGEAYVTKYLLKEIEVEDFIYFFPLMSKKDIEEITATLTSDKEWLLLTNSADWTIVSLDEIDFEDKTLTSGIIPFRTLNLNDNRKEWNVYRKRIAENIKAGKYNYI